MSFSDRELELDEPGDLSSLPWAERLGDGFLSPLPSSGRSASLAAQFRTERSGRDTPASVDSIPLEWDHDYDLSRGLESASRALREQQSEEGDFPQRPASALSGRFLGKHENIKSDKVMIRKLANRTECFLIILTLEALTLIVK